MDFSVLGPVQVRLGGHTVPVRRGLPRVLLVYLLMHPGEPSGAALLADRIWDGRPPGDAANAVHRVVSYLRRTLNEPERLPLRTTSGGYVLDVPADAVDSTRFSTLVRGAAGGPGEVLRSLDDALALWRGEPLSDAAGHSWAAPYVAELEELHVQAHERRLTCLLELGRHLDAVPQAQALAATYPLRETLRASLMLALYRSGRQGDALTEAASLRRTLVEEMGLDPSPLLADLEQRILRQDPALNAPAVAPTGSADHTRSSPAEDRSGGTSPDGARGLQAHRPVTSLVGRDDDLAAVSGAFDDGGLLTLTGPGGTGKTRLALAVLGRHGDLPTWFVDLSGVPDDATVASAVAAATGAPTAPGMDVVDAVVGHLGDRPGVLVLDTCEHVISGAAAIAGAVLHGCPRVRQLATSRRPLRVSGEVVWPVPPLTLPSSADDVSVEDVCRAASVELFTQRAVAVHPGFRVDHSTAADVAAICCALDGLPLAIELAAAHVDVLSPARIRDRLDNRFSLLVSDNRDVVARQRTLRAAIASSVDLLSQDERTVFASLAVFAGTFDLEAAAAVAPRGLQLTTDDHFRMVTSLLRQSLVARAGADRYRLLDSLRAYAAEMLAASPHADEVRVRHAEHHASVAEAGDREVRTDAQGPWLALLRETQPDLRAALAWCLEGHAPELGARLAGALAWFWTLEGQLAEARMWLDRAQQVAVADPRVRSRVLLGVGLVAAPLGHLAQARDACAEAAELSRTVGDDRGTGDALITLGVALWALGDMNGARAAHDEAIRRLGSAEDTWPRDVAVTLRARTALDSGDADAADRISAALAAARRTGDAHLVGLALTQQARDAIRTGRGAAAVVAAGEALEAYQRIRYREGEAGALTLLARAHLACGADVIAAELAEEALEIAAAINHRGALCHAVEALAAARAATGHGVEALALLDAAAQDRRAHGIPESSIEQQLTGELVATLRAGPEAAAGAFGQGRATSLDDVVAAHRRQVTTVSSSP